ncbi:hypothetical protein NSPZN2_100236 [Nitrospira defluvii]|uniref:Uncharacterized protein n=1 Tax=Nitrospira defluvii TaxID=330214 RepID=A0ABM8R217_9BACT|nr:hypothetical protein NSPZN2_100236 [Nitrospira defluvii]
MPRERNSPARLRRPCWAALSRIPAFDLNARLHVEPRVDCDATSECFRNLLGDGEGRGCTCGNIDEGRRESGRRPIILVTLVMGYRIGAQVMGKNEHLRRRRFDRFAVGCVVEKGEA